MSEHGEAMDEAEKLMKQVRRRIASLGIPDSEAARRAGVTPGSLARHLGGAYVRSDSLAKYRHWLATDGRTPEAPAAPQGAARPRNVAARPTVDPLLGPKAKPATAYRVVDLFGGCGGLSLGFELAGGGGIFQATLAIDVEEQMVRVFNANHPAHPSGVSVGRQADLAEFLNEAEVLAYYLDHLADLEADLELRRELDAIGPMGVAEFLQRIREHDTRFVEQISQARGKPEYVRAYSAVPKAALSQTSVLGFHKALKLPQAGSGFPKFDPPLWGSRGQSKGLQNKNGQRAPSASLVNEARRDAEHLWAGEIQKLRERAAGSGTGQLASAAEKIEESLRLLDGAGYAEVRRAWVEWRSARDALRRSYFEDEAVLDQLRGIYREGRAVHALLGGPPCQGFSRIGRGKIRSLREQSVHVQCDAHAGDKRNELMHQYVLFVAALSPAVFLFENVRHFQAEVKTPDGTFNATDVLAEAISNVSRDGLNYGVSSRVVMAEDHLVPQTRERFFMVGVRGDVEQRSERTGAAEWCLSLPTHTSVLLKTALTGLPEPVATTPERVRVEDLHLDGNGPNALFLQWIRQAPPRDRPLHDSRLVDAHCTRDSRPDDRAFFEMLGPGKRWMDYRCDGNPLVADLAKVVEWALTAARRGDASSGLDAKRLRELGEAVDGSLSLRLLLDGIPLAPGEVQHHLSSPNYLKKRDGQHGDWLARLDAEAPSKTMVSHMGKDTYAYVHPSAPRTISVREAARVQTFPDWFSFGSVGLVDAYRVIGNAVPPLLSSQLALRVGSLLEQAREAARPPRKEVRSTPTQPQQVPPGPA